MAEHGASKPGEGLRIGDAIAVLGRVAGMVVDFGQSWHAARLAEWRREATASRPVAPVRPLVQAQLPDTAPNEEDNL